MILVRNRQPQSSGNKINCRFSFLREITIINTKTVSDFGIKFDTVLLSLNGTNL